RIYTVRIEVRGSTFRSLPDAGAASFGDALLPRVSQVLIKTRQRELSLLDLSSRIPRQVVAPPGPGLTGPGQSCPLPDRILDVPLAPRHSGASVEIVHNLARTQRHLAAKPRIPFHTAALRVYESELAPLHSQHGHIRIDPHADLPQFRTPDLRRRIRR